MEELDYYTEDGKYLGFKSRKEIHSEGLWHNTVHCWLYDENGNAYFQIRKDTKTLYTTSSGHILKGETIKEAFHREIKEEIGLLIDTSDALLIDIVTWKMDKTLKDGSVFKDRAKANVYLDLFEGTYKDFKFDENEVLGVVKVNASDTLKLFNDEIKEINAIYYLSNKKKDIIEKKIDKNAFLVNKGETLIEKYGLILEKINDIVKK